MRHNALLLVALFLVTLVSSCSALIESRDVCILGAGAGGMSAAVFLKDRGYSVIVLEQADSTGGQSDTLRFTPPAGQTDSFVDPGVQQFPNTTDANLKGRGPWTLDTPSYFGRFATVLPLSQTARVNTWVDMKRGINQGVAPSVNRSDPAWIAALNTWNTILARYPWVDAGQVPDTVPAELLVDFETFVANNNLQPLVSSFFTSFLWGGGLGYFDEFTALYALLNLGPTIVGLFTGTNKAIYLANGVRSYYDGVEAYLGERNVLVNAEIKKVQRVTGQPSVVSGRIIDPSKRSYQYFEYKCNHVFIGFAPTYDKVNKIFNLDNTESTYYKKVNIRPYFSFAADVNGPAVDGLRYRFTNVDLQKENNFASLPAVGAVGRTLPYGPSWGTATGKKEITVDNMKEVIQDQLDNIPSSLATNATVLAVSRHEFQPYYYANQLAKTPSPNAVLRSLQGRRNTWVVGAVDSYASHLQITERTLHLIANNFPPK